MFFTLTIYTLESIIYLNIQVAGIALIGSTTESSANLFTGLDGDRLGRIEHSLFPVSVLCMRSSGESHRFMASSESDIEPCNECVNVIIASGRQLEVASKSQVFLGDSENIDFLCRGVNNCWRCVRVAQISFTLKGNGLVTTVLTSTVSTSGSLIASFLMEE